MDVVPAFEGQAEACAQLGSPMYADLIPRVARDHAAGGPAGAVLAGHEDDPGPSALALRLMGSVHRLVLERRADALAAYYPSVGGTWHDPEAAWAALRRLLADRPEDVREWLDRPPQTNEVGRATALVGGLLHLPDELRLPVRLFEIGSSAGLLLGADRFRLVPEDAPALGPAKARLVLDRAWRGSGPRAWPDLEFAERVGADTRPVDATTTAGRLALTAYVWPDQRPRLERLRHGFEVAAETAAQVRRQGAPDLVDTITIAPGHTTVLWHSVVWQYLTGQDQSRVSARVRELGDRAQRDAPFVHLFLEPSRRHAGSDHEFLVVLRAWPGGVRRVLGTCAPHGVPAVWEDG